MFIYEMDLPRLLVPRSGSLLPLTDLAAASLDVRDKAPYVNSTALIDLVFPKHCPH